MVSVKGKVQEGRGGQLARPGSAGKVFVSLCTSIGKISLLISMWEEI